MAESIQNMRIHIYGIQGSCSTFPSARDVRAWQELFETNVVERVFRELQNHTGQDGRLDGTVESVLGGMVRRRSFEQFARRLEVERPRVYGGWTTCIRVETADDFDIVFDCGSGFHNCARDLQFKWGELEERELYLFGSHSHIDHIEGLEQSAVCFDPRNTIHIHGNSRFLRALDDFLGIFSRHVRESIRGVYTPIDYSVMSATFRGTELQDDSAETSREDRPWSLRDFAPIELGNTRITPFEVYHSTPCLGYKIEHGERRFVFCTDHEQRHGDGPRQEQSEACEARVREFSRNADVLYRDAQYLRSEYDGITAIGASGAVPRIDWGHSCIEDVREMAIGCGVKDTYLGHHDPNREWPEQNQIDESLRRLCAKGPHKVQLARAGTVIDL